MADIASTLTAYFGITGKVIKERGNYIVKTKDGLYKISKTSEHPKAISKRYALLEYLTKGGFCHVDTLFLSRQGLPYINLGRETYVMTRHIKAKETDLNNVNDIKLILESLANFHKASCGGLKLDKNILPPKAMPLQQNWKKQVVLMENALKQVNRSSRLSDFDMMFLKNYDYFYKKSIEAAEALEKTDYWRMQDLAISQGNICHNALKEENLPIMNNICYITCITDSTQDLQLTDLAYFIRRYARRSDKSLSVLKLLEIYDSQNPLPSSAHDIILAQLTFPSPFIKILRQYYSKKRGWTPIALTSRMNTILEEQPSYNNYIIEV